MKDYTIRIVEETTGYPRLVPVWDTTKTFGVCEDNKAQCLVFERPVGRQNDELVLRLCDLNTDFGPIYMGRENRFPITNAFTQTAKLTLHIAFIHGGEEVEGTNPVFLRYREHGSEPLTQTGELPNPLLDMRNSAFCGVETHDTEDVLHLDFLNIRGEVVGSVQLPMAGSAVVQRESYLDFPTVGSANTLYIDLKENRMYRWDENALKYFVVGRDPGSIQVIDCGNAHSWEEA